MDVDTYFAFRVFDSDSLYLYYTSQSYISTTIQAQTAAAAALLGSESC